MNAANDDTDGSFSEDESEDSIVVEKDAGDLRDNNKGGTPEEDPRYLSTENRSKSKLGKCKPYVDSCNTGPRPDDDSDKEEGRWAQEANQTVGCRGDGTRGNVNKHGKKKNGSNTDQGKQRGISGNEESRYSSSYLAISNDLVGCVNTSTSKTWQQKERKCTVRENLSFESGQSAQCEIADPLSSCSSVNAHKVIDVHIRVSGRENATIVERSGSLKRFDQNRENFVIKREFLKEEYSDDFLESDALDSDRIPSADIFEVLDKLNLSTSVMKPPSPRGDSLKCRRVQSAGCTRRKASASRGEESLTKRGKCSRPLSAKQTVRPKKKPDRHDSTEINTPLSAFGTTEGVITHAREKLPGYFTEQYKKILNEKNGNNTKEHTVKTEVTSSGSRTLVARDVTEASRDLCCDEKHDQIAQTDLSSNYEENKTCLKMANSKHTGRDRYDAHSDEQGQSSASGRNSQSSLSGAFVTTGDKSELRGVYDGEVSSSGVETMSCITDCSSVERFGDAVDRSKCSSSHKCRGGENYDSRNDRQGYRDDHEEDVYYDEINDDDGNDGGVDGFDDDVSNLEVVAQSKPLSESRFV